MLALEPLFDILVIDDGSPDGTADIVRVLQKEHPGRIQMIERSGKLGLGTAYLTGFKKALESGYEYILRWMPISRTTPPTCRRFAKPVRQMARMWQWARAMSPE